MQTEITDYIYKKVKELMQHLGMSQSAIDRYDTLIISAIVIVIAIAAM